MGVEIRLQGTAIPCIAQEEIEAGLAVKLVPATNPSKQILGGNASPDPRLQGSMFNVVQGAAKPSANDDAEARYVAAFRVYNEAVPIYESLPASDEGNSTIPYTLREFGVAGESNLPATVKLRMVAPRLEETDTIPSGALMLAYDDGIYTITSGCVYGTSFAVGDKISVKAGGKWYNGSGGRVGTVLEYNTTTHRLTIKTGR